MDIEIVKQAARAALELLSDYILQGIQVIKAIEVKDIEEFGRLIYDNYLQGENFHYVALIVISVSAIHLSHRMSRLEKLPSNVDFLKNKPRKKK